MCRLSTGTIVAVTANQQKLSRRIFMQIRKLLIGALVGIALIGFAETASAQRDYGEWGGDRRSSQRWDGDRYSPSGWESGRRSRSRRYWRNSVSRYGRSWYASSRAISSPATLELRSLAAAAVLEQSSRKSPAGSPIPLLPELLKLH